MDILDLEPRPPRPAGAKFAVVSFVSPLVVVGAVYWSVYYGPFSKGYQPFAKNTPEDILFGIVFWVFLIGGLVSTFLSFWLREKRGFLKVFGLVLNLLITLPLLIINLLGHLGIT